MSQPIEAEPGAAAETDPAPTAPTQPTGPGPNDPVDISSLPANVQKLITGLRTENASSRTKAKTTAAEEARTAVLKQIGEALGITDGTPDPAKLTEQLTRSQEDAVTAQIELQVLRTASRLGANADRLLDSLSFRDKVDELDPEKFGEQLEQLIADELKSNPSLSAAPAKRFQGGADGGAREASGVTQLTEQDLKRMTPQQIVTARSEGRLRDLMGGS